MNRSSIIHYAFDNYCYCVDENTLRVSLRTGKDIVRVQIVAEDPFAGDVMGDMGVWKGKTFEITDCRQLESSLWWTIDFTPEFKRLRYYFIVSDGTEEAVLAESGFTTREAAESGAVSEFFIFPWMNSSDIVKTPEWAESAVWYQIFPSRFARGDNPLTDKEFLPWGKLGDPVKSGDEFGGNLRGIIGRLDYLKDIGITGIYMTPINLSPTQHKYDTTDYMTIDPDFGSPNDMVELVSEAHKRGIRIMLDGVFNHCGREFFAWKDVLEKHEKSRYASWFMVNDWNIVPGEPNALRGKFYSFAFTDRMPKLNTNNPEVRKYLSDVCRFWVEKYDIDGLRLDVANEVSHSFWKELYSLMKELKNDFYIVGEVWHNSLPWLREHEFDAVMNYPVQSAVASFFEKGFTSRQIEWAINRCMTMYYSQSAKVMLNAMDSHDTIRITSRLKSKEKAMQAVAMLFALPGSACIYYGTEVFLEGGHDPDCRRCMPWKEIDSGRFAEEIGFFRNLAALRKEKEALRSMDVSFVHGEDRLLHMVRTSSSERIHVFINGTGVSQKVPVRGSVLLAFNSTEEEIGADGILFVSE